MTVADRGQKWLETRDPATHTGATISWYRRYQAADGQLYAVLLSAYFFLTMFPAMLVETSYVTGKPAAFAVHAEHRLGLHNPTSTLFVSVFAGVSQHAFVAVLLAVLSLMTFGLGFGRVFSSSMPARGASTFERTRSSTKPATWLFWLRCSS